MLIPVIPKVRPLKRVAFSSRSCIFFAAIFAIIALAISSWHQFFIVLSVRSFRKLRRQFSKVFPFSHATCKLGYETGTSSANKVEKIVLLMHVWNPDRAFAAMSFWAYPRSVKMKSGLQTSASCVDIVTMYFTASQSMADFDWENFGTAPDDIIFLPENTVDSQRTETALAAVRFRHPDASWVFKCDDDTFVHVERLAMALLSFNSSLPHLLGRTDHEWGHFASGGAGYALSQAALSLILPRLAPFVVDIPNHEDVMIAACMKEICGVGSLTDIPGFYWHTPESLLARSSFRDIDANALAITLHYMKPDRMEAIVHPRVPRVLLQVWPFDADPEINMSSQLLFRDNIQSCEKAAERAGFRHRLINMRDTELGAAYYAGNLDARGRELLYRLNLAYVEGGVVASVWTRCTDDTMSALMKSAVGCRTSLESIATSRHFLTCSSNNDPACAVMVATKFNHDVFRLLAGLTRKIIHVDPSLFNNSVFLSGANGDFSAHWAQFAFQPKRNITEDLFGNVSSSFITFLGHSFSIDGLCGQSSVAERRLTT